MTLQKDDTFGGRVDKNRHKSQVSSNNSRKVLLLSTEGSINIQDAPKKYINRKNLKFFFIGQPINSIILETFILSLTVNIQLFISVLWKESRTK